MHIMLATILLYVVICMSMAIDQLGWYSYYTYGWSSSLPPWSRQIHVSMSSLAVSGI